MKQWRVRYVSRQCLVCDGSLTASQIPGLLQCSSCSFVTADVSLTPEELAALYGEGYFSGEEYGDYLGDRKTIQRNFSARLNKILRYVPQPSTKRLFEIGAAYGLFLDVARNRFAEVEGIDISGPATAYARTDLGLNVTEGDFLDYEIRKPIDVACMWDTIEHLQSPHLYIEKLARNMPPKGAIVITTGDIASMMAKWRGKRWRQIHPPTHLHYFSKATLAKLLNRYGFRVVYDGYDGMYRSVDFMSYYILVRRQNRPGLYSALKRTGLLNWNLYLNLYDIVFMIAEKTA